MARHRFIFVTMIICLTVCLCSCEKKVTDSASNQSVHKSDQHGTPDTVNAGLVDVIKNGKLVNFQSTTIGKAFDSYRYLTKKEWKASVLPSRHITVEFIGWLEPNTLSEQESKDGVKGKGINVKFVIEPNGSYYLFMVSKIETKSDGKVNGDELKDSAGILSSIYANKKISL